MDNISLSHTLSSLLEGSVPVYRGQSKHNIPTQAGIYVLLCTANGKPYVGRSVNLRNRFGEHHQPNYERCNGRKLANAKSKYGRDSFAFYVVETCDVEDLHEREIFYIKELDSVRCGYNSRCDSEGVVTWSPDAATRNKISQSLKEYYEENENPWKGKKHSDESRELIKKNIRNGDGTLKQQWSDESRKKMKEYGKKNLQFLSSWMKENEHPRNRKVVMLDKKSRDEIATFFSIQCALEFLGKPVGWSGIVNALNGRSKNAAGFGWKYLNSKTTLEEN